ncbi:YihY/virulence factor BrkB family protein [Limnoraphis robusta]|uniref:YihY/virulence factor BrkB family protein n=1 Tax=Limnoraphis robusta CCNP1315 TaxID=3110306 RepID=A0ABU5U915_9CYAN|nr:YihY/virulence factor BrkB family protein [Limnoraphis robusta]MEA5523332.1 YihY/virulence factor BrkB family protein [Limnoraphis robusta CCNP1315]MEA5545904.1 YihY/virulence factor BrkB family protein [Limnoraphis robusta CCNP1324]
MNLNTVLSLLRETFNEWQQDKVPILAAALSYYMIFSIAPLLILVIAVLGFIVGEQIAQEEVFTKLESLVGAENAVSIQTVLKNQFSPSSNIRATLVAIATILFGATTVFAQLKQALNMIWGVQPKPGRGLKDFIKTRILSIFMVLGIGLILLLSVIISSVLSGTNEILEKYLFIPSFIWSLVDLAISFGLITLLFAQIYRVLPDVKIAWKDVGVGAAMTAVLFIIGKSFISLYLGHSSIASAYGAAGSFVVLLMWIFYSTQIFLFGAEFTQVWSRRYGSQIRPNKNATSTLRE